MKTKIISILILILLLLSTIGITGSATQTCSMGDTEPYSSETIEVLKLIKNNSEWVSELNASVGSVVRFKINVTYHDVEGLGFKLNDIVVIDLLPSGLEYAGNPSEPYDNISADGKNITWYVYGNLEDNESHIIEFNVMVTDTGEQINKVNVSGIEYCYGEKRWGEAQATIIGLPEYDAKYKDVDDDETDEIAYNEDEDSSNGYEKFIDPDNSSEAVLSTDGDDDGKIDHFIDINKDGLPDRYWDPDDDILSEIWRIDVDYDVTIEWVYDSDGNGNYDKYYDPDDGKIYPYVAYTLTVNTTPVGSGNILIAPIGPFSPFYLKGFEVELSAVANPGWKFVRYSDDLNSNNPTVTVIMNSDKEISAIFEKEIVPPTIKITKPLSKHWYFFNIELESSEDQPYIVGPIKVEAEATSDKGIDRVEFYLNDELEPRKTDDSEPYTWFWFLKPLGKEKTFTITVKAYDEEGISNTDSITVTRARLLRAIIIGGLIGLIVLNLLKNREAPEDEKIPVEPEPNEEPVVDAGGPYTGVVGKPVGFDASKSYDPEGGDLSYRWDFGDGRDSSGKTPTHTYDKAGKYTITLTVTDYSGLSATDTTYVEITEEEETGGLIDEGDIFWYIVSGLSSGLIVLVGLLYYRRRLYV